MRFLLLVLIQGLILKRIAFNFGDFGFVHFFIYPILILILPLSTPRALVLVIGFLLGLSVDIFYDSIGVHASAAVFLAYIRPFVLNVLEPYEGYGVNAKPLISSMEFGWFLTYSSILLGLFTFFYFSVEAFSFVYIREILLNSIFSFIASLVLTLLLLFIFNPKT